MWKISRQGNEKGKLISFVGDGGYNGEDGGSSIK